MRNSRIAYHGEDCEHDLEHDGENDGEDLTKNEKTKGD